MADNQEGTFAPQALFRLSARELSLILPGLRELADIAELNLRANWDRGPAGRDHLVTLADQVISLERYFSAPHFTSRRRLRLNFIQISICALSLRATLKLAARGWITLPFSGWEPAGRSLLSKLERIRKKAKRVTIKRAGQTVYAAAETSWRSYAKDSRRRLFTPKRRSLNPGIMRFPKQVLKEALRLTREGLQRRHCSVPPDAELKAVVQMGIRNFRRSVKKWPNVREILTRPADTELFISYVQNKIIQNA